MEDFKYDEEKPEFNDVTRAEDFATKAALLGSRMMDNLLEKLNERMEESSDRKTILEMMRHFKIGINSVEDAAQAAAERASEMEGLDLNEEEDIHFNG